MSELIILPFGTDRQRRLCGPFTLHPQTRTRPVQIPSRLVFPDDTHRGLHEHHREGETFPRQVGGEDGPSVVLARIYDGRVRRSTGLEREPPYAVAPHDQRAKGR